MGDSRLLASKRVNKTTPVSTARTSRRKLCRLNPPCACIPLKSYPRCWLLRISVTFPHARRQNSDGSIRPSQVDLLWPADVGTSTVWSASSRVQRAPGSLSDVATIGVLLSARVVWIWPIAVTIVPLFTHLKLTPPVASIGVIERLLRVSEKLHLLWLTMVCLGSLLFYFCSTLKDPR
jgi:hypothetical protein